MERLEDRSRTLCGLMVHPHPDPADPRDHQVNGWSPDLPLDDKSCETCLRLRERAR
jgi:hypothetical protein